MKTTDFIRTVFEELCSHPEAIKIEEVQEEKGMLYRVIPHPRDVGKLIGSAGKTAEALRLVCRMKGKQDGQDINIMIASDRYAEQHA